ncbi:MAG: hypothetical protein HYV03_06645 [Deltaproteobacteria bacterium]|nr:hypothetical protein [Deltaproteobacteria bacterium]
MKPKLTRREALEYVRRYRAMNAIEREELRRAPLRIRARQVAHMMGFCLGMGWYTSSAAEIREVRQRWNRLREHFCG